MKDLIDTRSLSDPEWIKKMLALVSIENSEKKFLTDNVIPPEWVNLFIIRKLIAVKPIVDRYITDAVIAVATRERPLKIAHNRAFAQLLIGCLRNNLDYIMQHPQCDFLVKQAFKLYCDKTFNPDAQYLSEFWDDDSQFYNLPAVFLFTMKYVTIPNRYAQMRAWFALGPEVIIVRHADLSTMNLHEVDYRYADAYHTNFTNSYMARARLDYADLTGASFRDANLDGANFTGATLLSADLRTHDLKDTDFTDAIIGNINIYSSALSNKTLLKGILKGLNTLQRYFDFLDILSNMLKVEDENQGFKNKNHRAPVKNDHERRAIKDLSPAILQKLFEKQRELLKSAVEITVPKVKYFPLNLSELDCSRKIISGADLSNENLIKVNFSQSTLSDIKCKDTLLNESCFNEAKLLTVDFFGADLTGAVFSGAEMTACTFDRHAYENQSLVECIVQNAKTVEQLFIQLDKMNELYISEFSFDFSTYISPETLGRFKSRLLDLSKNQSLSKLELRRTIDFLGLPRYANSWSGWANYFYDKVFDTGATDSLRKCNSMVSSGQITLSNK